MAIYVDPEQQFKKNFNPVYGFSKSLKLRKENEAYMQDDLFQQQQEDEEKKRAAELRKQLKEQKIKFDEKADDKSLLEHFGNDKVKYGGKEYNTEEFFKDFDSRDKKTQKDLFYALARQADKGDADAQDALYRLKSTGRSRENSIKDAVGDFFVGGTDDLGFLDQRSVPLVGRLKRDLVDNLSGHNANKMMDRDEEIRRQAKEGKISYEDARVLQQESGRLALDNSYVDAAGGMNASGWQSRAKAGLYAGAYGALDAASLMGGAGAASLAKAGGTKVASKVGLSQVDDVAEEVIKRGGGSKAMALINALDEPTAKSMFARGAVEGAGYGGLDTVTQKDAGIKDYALNMGMGATIGGVLNPVAGKVTGLMQEGASKVTAPIKQKAGDAWQDVALPSIRNSKLAKFEEELSFQVRKNLSKAGDWAGDKPIVGKVLDLKDKAGNWISDDAPILRTARKMEFDGKAPKGFETGVRQKLKEVRGAFNSGISQLTSDEDFGVVRSVYSGLDSKGQKNLDQALNDMMELNWLKAGKRNFKDNAKVAAKLEARLAENPTAQTAQELFPSLNNLYTKRAQYMSDNGLTTPEMAEVFGANSDYIRLQKNQKGKITRNQAGNPYASSRSVDKKLKEVVDVDNNLPPLQTLMAFYGKTEQEVIGNAFKRDVLTGMARTGQAEFARNTEDVLAREAIYKELKASKPLKDELAKTIGKNKKLIKELDQYKGVLTKRAQDKVMAKSEDIKNFMIKQSAGVDRLPGNGKKLVGPINDPETLLNAYINDEKNGFKDVLTRMAKTDERAAKLKLELDRTIRKAENLAIERKNKMFEAKLLMDDPHAGDKFVSFYDKGVKNFVEVLDDPQIVETFKNISGSQSNDIIRALNKATRVFVTGQTGINYAFAPVNTIRDQAGAFINSPDALATANPVNFFKNAARTFAAEIMGQEDSLYAKYNQFGGNTILDSFEELNIMAKAEMKKKAGMKLSASEKLVHTPMAIAEKPTRFSENLTRSQVYSGIYNKALKQLNDEEKAARYAMLYSKEASTDFQDTSKYLRTLNSFLPYFSSSVQGARTMARSLRDRPVTTSAKALALVGGPMALSMRWNTSDENRKQIYETIPEYQREANFVIVTPGASIDDKGKISGVILIPKPQGFNQLLEPLRQEMEKNAGITTADTDRELANDIVEAFTSIDPTMQGLMSKSIPQQVKPFVQQGLNRDIFTGQSIVPEEMTGLPANEQVQDNTSNVARELADKFGVSPLRVEKLIKDIFGETGVIGMNTIDQATAKISGNEDQPIGGRDLEGAVSRRFNAQNSGEATAFYDQYEPLKNTRDWYYKKINNAKYKGNVGEMERLSREWDARITEAMGGYMDQYGNNQFTPEYRMDQIETLRIPVEKGKIKRYNSNRKQK